MTDKKDTHNGPTVKLRNNATMNLKNTGNIPLSGNLILNEKRAQTFYGLHIASLISLGQLWDNYCINILDKNEIVIIKYSKQIFKEYRNKSD